MAAFVGTPTSGEAPLTVSFDASASSDPDGDLLSYVWDFGDGNTDSGITASHTFDQVGNFTVTLTASDGEFSGSAARTILGGTSGKSTLTAPDCGRLPLGLITMFSRRIWVTDE